MATDQDHLAGGLAPGLGKGRRPDLGDLAVDHAGEFIDHDFFGLLADYRGQVGAEFLPCGKHLIRVQPTGHAAWGRAIDREKEFDYYAQNQGNCDFRWELS